MQRRVFKTPKLRFILELRSCSVGLYLLYASMHYAIHAWNPPFKWMKPLWRNHHLHHYKDEEKGFGVSSTIWDLVFGTMFDLKKEKEDKEKVKALMFEKNTGARSQNSGVGV